MLVVVPVQVIERPDDPEAEGAGGEQPMLPPMLMMALLRQMMMQRMFMMMIMQRMQQMQRLQMMMMQRPVMMQPPQPQPPAQQQPPQQQANGTLGPLRPQEKPMSCVIASTRMMIETLTGRNIPEGQLRDQSQQFPGAYHPQNGTMLTNSVALLQANGVNAQMHTGVPLTALAGHTPAIAHIAYPGGGGHVVVIDNVTPDGMVTVRDPAPPGQGSIYTIPASQFPPRSMYGNGYYSGTVITTS